MVRDTTTSTSIDLEEAKIGKGTASISVGHNRERFDYDSGASDAKFSSFSQKDRQER